MSTTAPTMFDLLDRRKMFVEEQKRKEDEMVALMKDVGNEGNLVRFVAFLTPETYPQPRPKLIPHPNTDFWMAPWNNFLHTQRNRAISDLPALTEWAREDAQTDAMRPLWQILGLTIPGGGIPPSGSGVVPMESP
jgi:hypothetical protein